MSSEEILTDAFSEKLKEMPDDEFVKTIVSVPRDKFTEFLDKHADVIDKRLRKLELKAYATLVEELPADLRKEFNKRFFQAMRELGSKLSLRDMIKVMYNISPPNRSSLLSPWRPVIFSPEFRKKALEASLEDLEEFLSTAPEDIRKQIVNKHKDFFLSKEFKEKLRSATPEQIVNLLRWFPDSLYRAFVRAHEDVLSEKGLKL